MKTKTKISAGGMTSNHNETLVRDAAKSQGLKVKTRGKAGSLVRNHNETLVADR
jgi:hypothetical protein